MTLTTTKTFKFQQRWRELEKSQKDIDFQRSQFARDLRGEFPIGNIGDKQFTNWCTDELGLIGAQATELLMRARALEVVPDETSYKAVGGYQAIRHTTHLPKREQIAVIAAAKAQVKNVKTIVRERATAQALTTSRATSAAGFMETKRVSLADDLRALSNWVRQTHGHDLPKKISIIVERYATAFAAAQAA